MKRDVRRFVYFRWRLLEAPASSPVSLVREWRSRFGFLPPFPMGHAVAGWHFSLADGGRGVKVSRPEGVPVLGQIQAQLFAVIGAKHCVEEVRLAEPEESPDLAADDRLPEPEDYERVEVWPKPSQRQLPVVLTSAHWFYVRERSASHGLGGSFTPNLDEAEIFACAEEAEAWADDSDFRHQLRPVFVAVARALAEQREASALDEAGGTAGIPS